jgi:hypothetical protein
LNRWPFPEPVKCHACEHRYVGAVCPICKAERPAYTALKAESQRARPLATPLRNPQACRYFPKSICGCDQRGLCLEPA